MKSSNTQPTKIGCGQKTFVVLHTTLLVCEIFRRLVNTDTNYKSVCRLTIIFALLTPHSSIADTSHSAGYHLSNSSTALLAWGIADINVENNKPFGYSVFGNHAANNSKLQQPAVSTSANKFQPIKNDREMLKQLRSLMSKYTNTHPSINWLPASRADGYFEKPSHQAKLNKSAIRSALRRSIVQWWQNRKALSNIRKGAKLSAMPNSTQIKSQTYRKNWGYKFNVSSNKVKFTLKREL